MNFSVTGSGQRFASSRESESMTAERSGRPDVRSAIERVFRVEYGKVIATLIGTLRDFDLAEEALQDAFTVALERWPRDGIPPNPAAWLATMAKRKAIDTWRRERQRADKYAALARAGLSSTSAEDDDVDSQAS